MKRLVADTGPLLHLHEAAALHLLPLVGTVTVPARILAELRSHAPKLWVSELPSWIRVEDLSLQARQRSMAWQQSSLLHSGEAEALALAEQTRPDWFLTDDAAARLFAESLKMEVRGSLGVVLWCAAKQLILRDDAEACLTRLEKSSLWTSPRVRLNARSALAKLYLA